MYVYLVKSTSDDGDSSEYVYSTFALAKQEAFNIFDASDVDVYDGPFNKSEVAKLAAYTEEDISTHDLSVEIQEGWWISICRVKVDGDVVDNLPPPNPTLQITSRERNALSAGVYWLKANKEASGEAIFQYMTNGNTEQGLDFKELCALLLKLSSFGK